MNVFIHVEQKKNLLNFFYFTEIMSPDKEILIENAV